MWEDLASVKEVVDLSPQEALDSAQTVLVGLGYDVTHRTSTTLSVKRQDLGSTAEVRDESKRLARATAVRYGGIRGTVGSHRQWAHVVQIKTL